MATKFKGVDLDGDLERVIPHVAAAEEYGGALQHLQSVWDDLTLLGELSGSNTDMSGTRVAFRELAETLLNQLGREALKKCLQDLSAKAQVAINILVRNLFERTADIGFLSCDDDVRAFLGDPGSRNDKLASLRRRFGAYVRKYSVYSDVILLDTSGHVLARFDDAINLPASADPAIRAAIETKAPYVESFRVSDMIAGPNRSLIYSYRVADRTSARRPPRHGRRASRSAPTACRPASRKRSRPSSSANVCLPRAAEIVEAIDAKGIVALPLMPVGMTGCLMYRGAPLPVFDTMRALQEGRTSDARPAAQVVVMATASGNRFGLMVDRLGEIVEVGEDRVRFLPSMVAAEDTFADAALTPDSVSDGALVVVLRADQLYANLAASAPAVAEIKMAAA